MVAGGAAGVTDLLEDGVADILLKSSCLCSFLLLDRFALGPLLIGEAKRFPIV